MSPTAVSPRPFRTTAEEFDPAGAPHPDDVVLPGHFTPRDSHLRVTAHCRACNEFVSLDTDFVFEEGALPEPSNTYRFVWLCLDCGLTNRTIVHTTDFA